MKNTNTHIFNYQVQAALKFEIHLFTYFCTFT